MRKTIFAALATALLLPVAVPTTAEAQAWRNERWQGRQYYDRDGRYRQPKRLGRNDHVWRGRDGHYYCKRDNGTTGLIVGGVAGALLGRSIAGNGDRTLGTLLGGAGGAVLGRSIDRGDVKCR
jgi:outer membrane lipoprotein SlyB